MAILTGALPGIRDLRAPATAGYLWLFFLWLLLTPDLSEKPGPNTLGGLASSLYELGGELGTVGIGVAVSLVAYLIGVISQGVSGVPLKKWVKRRTGREEDDLERRPEAMSVHVRDRIKALDLCREESDRLEERIHEQEGQVCRDVVAQLQLPPALLLGDNEQLFGEVDRLRAEGDFRTAVALPLLALCVLLVVKTDDALWALPIVGVVLLAIQGASRATEARRLTAVAIESERVSSPVLTRHAGWLESFADRELPAPPSADGANDAPATSQSVRQSAAARP